MTKIISVRLLLIVYLLLVNGHAHIDSYVGCAWCQWQIIDNTQVIYKWNTGNVYVVHR